MSTVPGNANRRSLACLLVLMLAVPRSLVAHDAALLPPRLDDAVARGLDYLARQQNADGSFSTGRNADGTPGTVPAPPVATTGLSLLAFLSAGHAPDVGRHGLVVRGAIDVLVAKVPDSGYVGAVAGDRGDDSRMYGQGIVTLALAEAYGVENNRERRTMMRGAIAKMLGVILAAQAVQKSEVHAGGWGETPDAQDSNLWVTGWNVLALTACRDAGFNVPPEAPTRAAHYVLKCRNPLDRGFAFQPGGRGEPATTAIGVVCLNLLDNATPPELVDARKFLAQAAPATQPSTRFPLYSAYCGVQADIQAGEPTWSTRARPVLDALLGAQTPDGGWPPGANDEEPGRSHATALTVLTLSVPYRLLPLYQE